MARRIVCVLFAIAMINLAGLAHATARYVGTCVKAPFVYSTISAAVTASNPNDRINVCPGTYPEQVVISKPLFLAGMEAASGTVAQDRAVIILPSTPFVTVRSQYNNQTFAPQILVQNVNPAGSFGVDIDNLTVDGSADPAGQPYSCQGIGITPGLVGVFYDATNSAPGTVVRISDVATRNQLTQNIACGYGIWVENDSPTNQSVTVQNNSVHDFDLGGITAVTGPGGVPPALTATIKGNFVHSGSACPACLPYGIDAEDIDGTILGNIVTGGGYGIMNGSSAISITSNTIAGGSGTGIYIFMDGASTLASNNITNVGTAFDVYNSSNPGPTIKSNTTKNTQTVVNYECSSNVTVTSNTFGNSAIGFSKNPGTAPTPNSVSNIDTITSSCL